MPRSSFSGKRSKGQWFLISAVVATSAFLVVSGIFRTYSDVDPSKTARLNEQDHFRNIRDQFYQIVQTSSCSTIADNLREFRVLAEKVMASKGYLLYMNYTYNCPSRSGRLGLLLSSSNAVFCQNVEINDIMPPETVINCANV